MTRPIAKLAAVCGTAALLAGTAAMPANALYLGYGNGDPGSCGDFWTFQNGCKPLTPAPAPSIRHAQTRAPHHYHHAYHHAYHHQVPPSHQVPPRMYKSS